MITEENSYFTILEAFLVNSKQHQETQCSTSVHTQDVPTKSFNFYFPEKETHIHSKNNAYTNSKKQNIKVAFFTHILLSLDIIIPLQSSYKIPDTHITTWK